MNGQAIALIGALFAPEMAGAENALPWNARAAARSLDGRAEAWKSHHETQRSEDTACISCHTALPYLLARPALRRALGEAASAPPEDALVADVEKRTRLWEQVEPWYAETTEKARESKGTESILNAFVLALRDREQGALRPLTRQALDHMWKEQHRDGPAKGGWSWLRFGLAPWETNESEVWGACLAALALTAAPGYATEAEAQGPARLLQDYLRRGAAGSLNLHSRLGILWASTSWKDLLEPANKANLAREVLKVQRPDGGFSLATLGRWEREDGSPPEEGSDGYATGLVTYVLLRAGDSAFEPAIEKGRAWLAAHQQAEGHWDARSANLDRTKSDPFVRRFMQDAASGYAVLALTEAEARRPSRP